MYPSDDGHIRARLLIAQCREARLRLKEQFAAWMEERDRAAARPSGAPPPAAAEPGVSGGGERCDPAA
jgi:hypothetical protein